MDEVATALRMSPRTIERYVSKVLNFGDVKANTIGRLWNLIIEAVLKYPEKTLSEIVHDVYTETGSDFALARIFYYLKRNRLSLNKVCLNLLWNQFFNKTYVYVCIMNNMANCNLIVFLYITLSAICGLHRIAITCNLFFFTLFRSPPKNGKSEGSSSLS